MSAEIVAITLGIVAEAPLINQVLVLSGIALVVTVGVYGLVGVIVKIDDLGYWLAEKSSALMQALGKGLLIIAPWLMKALSIVGTLAMFLVGGGIVVHGITPLHHAIEHFAGQQSAVVAMILPTVLNLILGFIIGGIVVLGSESRSENARSGTLILAQAIMQNSPSSTKVNKFHSKKGGEYELYG
ncbi:putative methyl-independent mismatch repair protein [Escherichia coli]|nr:putative methyl-independent mismatch repair protein [Escherichia coli]